MRTLAPALNTMGNRGVRYRVRKGAVIEITGAVCTVDFAGGPVGGVIPSKGYTPNVGDIVLVERVAGISYALGAIPPP